MSDTKTVLEQIKDEYAQKEYGFNDWAEFLADNRDRPKSVDKAWAEVSRRYATACSKASLEKGAENARTEHTGKYIGSYEVDKDSITDPDNIVLL